MRGKQCFRGKVFVRVVYIHYVIYWCWNFLFWGVFEKRVPAFCAYYSPCFQPWHCARVWWSCANSCQRSTQNRYSVIKFSNNPNFPTKVSVGGGHLVSSCVPPVTLLVCVLLSWSWCPLIQLILWYNVSFDTTYPLIQLNALLIQLMISGVSYSKAD